MMRAIPLLAAFSCLCACAVPQGGMQGNPFSPRLAKRSAPAAQAQQQYVDETIDVLTQPPGARILVNDTFAGYAPVRYDVRRFWRGRPGYMTLDTVKVEALPAAAGQCVQAGVFGANAQKTPPQVLFNMSDCAAGSAAPRR